MKCVSDKQSVIDLVAGIEDVNKWCMLHRAREETSRGWGMECSHTELQHNRRLMDRFMTYHHLLYNRFFLPAYYRHIFSLE